MTADGAGQAGSGAAGADGSDSASETAAGDDAATDAAATADPPASCADAALAYQLETTPLDSSFAPAAPAQVWSGEVAHTPVAVAADGTVYVGFNVAGGGAMIVRSDAPAGGGFSLPDAAMGALAATADGVAALLFDPNPTVDSRTWATVVRLGSDGSPVFQSDLFRSPNLDDVDTKGGAASGVLAYIAETDTLVPYLGHTQRYDDGVRHQGGYLATIDASGNQSVISGWFGSHNLSQRILVDGARVVTLGLGDAFPKGIFLNYAEGARLQPQVIYRLAADGVGSANAKLGGMVDLGSDIALPFITNLSISQDLDAGAWPNTDEAISMQIRDAAANGTDLGLLLAPKGATPGAELAPSWIDLTPSPGARLSRLRSAPYGADMILLGWAELTGSEWNPTATFFTMVVDSSGAICQPATQLPAGHGWASGDDIKALPDGSITWANAEGGGIQLVRLVP
ncbi:MAG: hypothetical protein OEZ06_12280 [Myxococcales bacterium]|nr:hypothetical protein [Myxococcales bacterium]